jgi:hypothetical protein
LLNVAKAAVPAVTVLLLDGDENMRWRAHRALEKDRAALICSPHGLRRVAAPDCPASLVGNAHI